MAEACAVSRRLHLLYDGALSSHEAEAVRQHLPDCAICRLELEDLFQLDAAAERARARAQNRRAAEREDWTVLAILGVLVLLGVAVVLLAGAAALSRCPTGGGRGNSAGAPAVVGPGSPRAGGEP